MWNCTVPLLSTNTTIAVSEPKTRNAWPVYDSCSSVARLVLLNRRSVVWLVAVVSVTNDPFASQRASAICAPNEPDHVSPFCA